MQQKQHEQNPPASTLGIVGVGYLATYVVDGLRHGGDKRTIVLSSRSASRAQDLRDRCDCLIAEDNQEVADRAEIILLATRPSDALAALERLTLRPNQLIISVAAGLSVDTLALLALPAVLVRAMPVCCAEVGEGAIPLYPDEPRARALLEKIGAVVAFTDEAHFELATVAACVNGWFFQLFADLSRWLADAGIEPEQARILMLQAARGATGLALQRPMLDLQELASTIASPGTYTGLGLDLLKERQAFTAWTDACGAVLQRLSGHP